MASISFLLFCGSLAITTATRSITHLRQSGKMNPEAVANTLVKVEGKWTSMAVAFQQCNSSDTACQDDTLGEFKNSCQTVVKAIIQSSNGDKSVVTEYLGDVCDQPQLHNWKQSFCNNFATALTGVLTDDSYVNRDDLPVDTICANFITRGFLKEQAKEEVALAAKQREMEEEREKKEAEEQAAAEEKERKAREDDERKEREEAAKAEAAKAAEEAAAKIRAEAQAKADEAAKKVSQAASEQESNNSSTAVAAVNTTADASKDTTGAASNVTAPVSATSEVVANNTAVTPSANSTATVPSSNNTK